MYRQNSTSEWSDEDRRDYGHVIRTLQDLDTRVPRAQVIPRLQMFEVKTEVRRAAIKRWERDVAKQESKY